LREPKSGEVARVLRNTPKRRQQKKNRIGQKEERIRRLSSPQKEGLTVSSDSVLRISAIEKSQGPREAKVTRKKGREFPS